MKKRAELFKTIQLIVYVLIAVEGLILIFKNDDLYQMIGSNLPVKLLAALLWATLGLSFLFILADFRITASLKKDYRELDYALKNDRLSGIANRYSCDAVIEKYMDKPLPRNLGCVMLELSNIRDINEKYSHLQGNGAIQEFSGMLLTASVGLCFVGRNGGNKFMALFEDCSEDKLNSFLARVNKKIEEHNAVENAIVIEYRTGRSFSKEEYVGTVTQLISLADKRLAAQNDAVTGFANRAGCDDIIGMYIDKPLPESIGCVMLDIINIREINEANGHLEGNKAIRQFGDALRDAAMGLGFVGRNGGTKFMALFEECSDDKLEKFFSNLARRVDTYNNLPGVSPIKYKSGVAFREGPSVTQINRLVALADRRLKEDADVNA